MGEQDETADPGAGAAGRPGRSTLPSRAGTNRLADPRATLTLALTGGLVVAGAQLLWPSSAGTLAIVFATMTLASLVSWRLRARREGRSRW